MNRIIMNKVTFILIVFLTAFGSHAFAQFSIGSGSAKDVYQEFCASCHGKNLQGGTGSSLIDDEWKYGGSDEEIAKVIKHGLPDAGMPPWDESLSDEQIRALVILIREQQKLADEGQQIKRASPKGGVFTSDKHKFKLEKVAESDGILWSLDFLPDGAMLVTQQDGKLWRFKDGKRHGPIKGTPKVLHKGQGGLLEAQLHPDYEKNKWVYLSYSEQSDGGAMTAVVRGRIKDGKWVDQEDIFRVPVNLHFSTHHHYGSRFVFKDGYLFFSIGDRGKQEMAQDLSRPNGKIHRIFDDGRVPKDNPFYDRDEAYKTVWSYGHRNPQGMDKHPVTGALWETEHGPRGGDEVNLVEKGKNYGWPVITYGMNYDGRPITDKTHMEGMEQPKHYWTPSIAVAGIDFYEGDKFPGWKHNLFVGGMSSEELRRLEIVGDNVVEDELIIKNQGRVRDVASGPDGYLYLLLNTRTPLAGGVYRLVPAK